VAVAVALLPIPTILAVSAGLVVYALILLTLGAIPLDVLRAAFGGWRSS